MAATRNDLERWFDAGIELGATHMVVMCGTFDWDDYPVYVRPDQNVREVVAELDGQNMQKLMEVYDLRLSKALQMAEERACHY